MSCSPGLSLDVEVDDDGSTPTGKVLTRVWRGLAAYVR